MTFSQPIATTLRFHRFTGAVTPCHEPLTHRVRKTPFPKSDCERRESFSSPPDTIPYPELTLIKYTQKQAVLWSLPIIKGVPISHIFDIETLTWRDEYVDLPLSPVDSSPILLVPRRIVRSLPWINYEDFLRLEFTSYLRAKRVKSKLKGNQISTSSLLPPLLKKQVIEIARSEIERVENYIYRKESEASDAQPSSTYIDAPTCLDSEQLKQQLKVIPTGRESASTYQHLVLAILNFLFNPQLIDGNTEVRTIDGTERRDIIFTNDSDESFWTYIRLEHSSFLIMFEVKNTSTIEPAYLNQTATYLGDRIGRLGFIVTRQSASEPQQRKAFSIYNDSYPRKVILILSDTDLECMLDIKCKGEEPMRYIQKIYRQFRTSVQ